ncbi:hypothetical protein SDC9_45904 [bioreactor metagenome]|uniref:Uncharacterized protein n=1 Tax=bioreactor metagenome TaxID=1076179 RepID=A0A644W7A7_9ZZZZ
MGLGAGKGIGVPEVPEEVRRRSVAGGEGYRDVQGLQGVERNQACDELIGHLVAEHRFAPLIDLHVYVFRLDPSIAVIPALALDGKVGSEAFNLAHEIGGAVGL